MTNAGGAATNAKVTAWLHAGDWLETKFSRNGCVVTSGSIKMLAGGVLKATEKASQIIETWKVLETAATEVYERSDTENVTVWTPV